MSHLLEWLIFMARNTIGAPPFPPVVIFDDGDLFTRQKLDSLLKTRRDGVSICLRYADGPPTRGGYFFHFGPSKNTRGMLTLYDFERRDVKDFDPDDLIRFINHCTGQQFDEDSFLLCQSELNFLQDE